MMSPEAAEANTVLNEACKENFGGGCSKKLMPPAPEKSTGNFAIHRPKTVAKSLTDAERRPLAQLHRVWAQRSAP
jgi:hypothetical protein